MFKAEEKKDLINVTLADLSPEFQPDGELLRKNGADEQDRCA